MAVAHKQIIAAYFTLKNNEDYKEPVLHNNPQKQEKKAKSYLAKLKELGCEVAMKPKEETKKVLEEQKV